MNILAIFILVTVSSLVLLIGVLQAERRKKAIERCFLRGEKKAKFVRINTFIIKFGKENRAELEQKLRDAGLHNKEFAKYYFPLKFILVACAVVVTFIYPMGIMQKLMFVLASLFTFIILPDLYLAVRTKLIVRRISKNLPYLLDMMSVCVQTGMTIEASFAYLSKELEGFDKNLCYQIRRTSDVGKIHGIEYALNDMSERLPTPEISSFVLTIIQNIHYGSSVANILSDLAEDMRKMQILNVEEKMGKLSAQMSVPLILLIMVPIVILILAPGIMQMNFEL